MFLLAFVSFYLRLATGYADFAITAAPAFPFKRQNGITECDQGNGLFRCGRGTSSCAPRTTCIEYADLDDNDCDHNTRGCVRCTNADAPFCVTLTSPVMEQYAYYCDQVSAAETRSFTYEIPSGGVIRTVGGDDETTSTEDDPTTTMEEEEPETETIEGLRETIQTKRAEPDSGILGTSDPRNPSTTSAEPTTDEPTANSSDSEPHVAVIVAAVLGSVLGTTLIAGIAGIAFFFYRRRHRQPPQPMDMAPYTHQQPISTQQSPDSLQGTFGTFTGYSSVPNHSPSPRDSSFSGSVVGLANQSYRTGESMPQISELASTNESPSMKHPSVSELGTHRY
ncbi:hypothetical protein ACJ41O_015268 [Fusarium nematophilum]